MTLSIIVETGSIVTGANSYVTVANVNAYATLMNLTDNFGDTDDDDDTAIQAIIIACRSLEQQWGPRYLSCMLPATIQPLLWPRYIFWDNSSRLVTQGTIPQPLKDAQCQLSIDYLANASDINYLFPKPNEDSAIIQTDVKVGDVSQSKRYARSNIVSNFTVVESILWPIVRGAGPRNYQVSL